MWKIITAVASALSIGIYLYFTWQGRKQAQAEIDADKAKKARHDADIAAEPFVDNPLDELRKKESE